ncbi:hypothetical protein RF55_13357 [Lasius niger]|uniref:Uncharacterized protein n=1 Tax=Lasius niger TaxID=67767 RepID=A0A0J7KAQ3_LASNI|nr:hypothetical protein RF55_13357 [Lasius niger]
MAVVELPGEDLSAIVLRSLEYLGVSLPGQSVSVDEASATLERTLEEECSDRTPEEALERAEKVGAVKRVGKSRDELTPQFFPPLLWPSSGSFFRHHSLVPDQENEEVYLNAESLASKILLLLVSAALEGKTVLDTVLVKKLALEENWFLSESSQKTLWLLKQVLAVPVLKDGTRTKGHIPPLLSLLHDKEFLYPEGGLSQLASQEGWAELSPEDRRKQLKLLWNEIYEFPYWKSLPVALGVVK